MAQFAAYLAAAIAFIVWFRRAYRNTAGLGATGMRYKPGWSTGAWFVPILNLFRPKQISNDIWRASDPELPRQATGWQGNEVHALIHWWWAIWIVAGFFSNISASVYFNAETLSEQLIASAGLSLRERDLHRDRRARDPRRARDHDPPGAARGDIQRARAGAARAPGPAPAARRSRLRARRPHDGDRADRAGPRAHRLRAVHDERARRPEVDGADDPQRRVHLASTCDAYDTLDPQVGDIVSLQAPANAATGSCAVARRPDQICRRSSQRLSDEFLIKRIVAGPGQSIVDQPRGSRARRRRAGAGAVSHRVRAVGPLPARAPGHGAAGPVLRDGRQPPLFQRQPLLGARAPRGDRRARDATRSVAAVKGQALAATPLRSATRATMSRMICVRSKSFGV